jgi:hypothetical protein
VSEVGGEVDRRREQAPNTLSRAQVHEFINQLVEAAFEQEDAASRLRHFRESNDPPPRRRAPSEFNSLEAFLDFHDQRNRYNEGIRNLEAERDAARERYDQAQRTLRAVLPTNTSLRFTYEGPRQELEGVRYTIINRGIGGGASQIEVSSVRP